jgi:tripartite-type tricarboxylate transporter receptor subunit TctC
MLTKRLFVACICTVLAAAPAFAQEKLPIRIMVGVPPGGSTDLIARALAEKMREILSEPVVVENRPGANQRIALAEVKKAAPDGRTFIVTTSGLFSLLPNIYGDRLDYDAVNDFTPISRIVVFPLGLGAAGNTGAKNVKEFTEWAKANPAKAAFATPGAGTSSQFVGVMFSTAIGVPLSHVPYKGGAPAVTDLVGGHVPMTITSLADLVEYHRAGKIQIIASAGPKRSPIEPDIPTLREQGVDVGVNIAIDIYSTGHIPADIVKRMNEVVVQAINMPDTQARYIGYGLQPSPTTSEELAALQKQETEIWAAPVKASGFTGE